MKEKKKKALEASPPPLVNLGWDSGEAKCNNMAIISHVNW